MTCSANNAHSVDAPIALVFHIGHHWRRAIDAQRNLSFVGRGQRLPILDYHLLTFHSPPLNLDPFERRL